MQMDYLESMVMLVASISHTKHLKKNIQFPYHLSFVFFCSMSHVKKLLQYTFQR